MPRVLLGTRVPARAGRRGRRACRRVAFAGASCCISGKLWGAAAAAAAAAGAVSSRYARGSPRRSGPGRRGQGARQDCRGSLPSKGAHGPRHGGGQSTATGGRRGRLTPRPRQPRAERDCVHRYNNATHWNTPPTSSTRWAAAVNCNAPVPGQRLGGRRRARGPPSMRWGPAPPPPRGLHSDLAAANRPGPPRAAPPVQTVSAYIGSQRHIHCTKQASGEARGARGSWGRARACTGSRWPPAAAGANAWRGRRPGTI
jgi:hypothetical protein